MIKIKILKHKTKDILFLNLVLYIIIFSNNSEDTIKIWLQWLRNLMHDQNSLQN